MPQEGRKPRIGILTWHYYANVGSNLQAYAMQRVLSSMGLDARFVNYRKKEFDSDRFPKGLVKAVCSTAPFLPSFDTWRFQRDELRQTKKTYTAEGARGLCNKFDVVVCGSDQIWAPNVFDPVYMLEGVSERVRKISYAASIGLPDIPENLRSRYRELLSRFDAIGVREEQGRNLIRSELGLDATTVLDPTFLLSREAWAELADAPFADDRRCIFCYFLGSPSRYAASIAAAAKQTRLPVIAYLPEAGDAMIPGCKVIRNMAVPEFLGWLQASSLVMTDSFHGMALSINLGRDFVVYRRFDDGDSLNQNSRILNILDKLGIRDHLQPLGDFIRMDVDWAAVNSRLDVERTASHEFLVRALERFGGDVQCRS